MCVSLGDYRRDFAGARKAVTCIWRNDSFTDVGALEADVNVYDAGGAMMYNMFVPMVADKQIYVGHVRPGAWFTFSMIHGFTSPGDYTTEVSRGVGPPLLLPPLGWDL